MDSTDRNHCASTGITLQCVQTFRVCTTTPSLHVETLRNSHNGLLGKELFKTIYTSTKEVTSLKITIQIWLDVLSQFRAMEKEGSGHDLTEDV